MTGSPLRKEVRPVRTPTLDPDHFAAEIAGILTAEALAGYLARVIRPLGLEVFAIGRLPSGGGPGEMYLANWPAAWMLRYVADNFAAEDIVVHEALRSPEPFTWTQLKMRRPGEALRLFAAAAELGWHDGFAVPLHGPEGLRGLASFAGPRCRLTAGERAPMVAIAHAAYHRAGLLFRQGTKSVVLTPREREALSLVAQGMGDGDIALALNVSRTTAHAHVERAKKRLGAVTRAQAVAIALQWKLI